MLRRNERKLTADEVKALPDGAQVRVYGRDRYGYTVWKECDVVTEGRSKKLRYLDRTVMMVKRIPIRKLDGVVHYYTVEEARDG